VTEVGQSHASCKEKGLGDGVFVRRFANGKLNEDCTHLRTMESCKGVGMVKT